MKQRPAYAVATFVVAMLWAWEGHAQVAESQQLQRPVATTLQSPSGDTFPPADLLVTPAAINALRVVTTVDCHLAMRAEIRAVLTTSGRVPR